MKAKLDKSEIENIAALTPFQEGVLFHYLKDPESNQYFEQLSLNISGDIDITNFRKAWNLVVQFNETLRTIFRWQGLDKPVQVFLKKHELDITIYDFSGQSPRDQKRLIEDVRIKDRKTKFDLTQVPFRVLLCKIQPDRYEIIISNHHIIYDGWSNGIILKEFLEFYHDLTNNTQPARPAKRKYLEFVKWLQAQDSGKQKKFWKEYLEGFGAKTELPVKNRKKMGVYAKEARTYPIHTGIPLKNQLEAYARHQKVTLSSLIFVAWGLLLQRYTNDNDVLFGTTVSGRTAKINDIDKMVGLFINTLPLRIKTNAGETIDQLVKKVNVILSNREEAGYISPAAISDYTGLEKKDELFDSVMVVDNYPLDMLFWQNKSGLSITGYSIFEMSHYDLTISVMLADDIEIRFIYGKDVFEKEAVINLCGHFVGLLESIVHNPDAKVVELDILTEKEKELLLIDFNSTNRDYPKERTAIALFRQQALAVPDHIAVGCDEKMVSYKELDAKVNRLARLLIGEGVRNSDIVGLVIRRSLDLIIGITAILKVNAICLPIALTYPDKRKRELIRDSGAGFVLQGADNNYHPDANVKVINVQYPDTDPGAEAWKPLSSKAVNDGAFVFYTSGSTGRPKGVLITHMGTINNIYAKIKEMDLNRQDIFCQCLNISFAASPWQIYAPLILGSLVYIYPEQVLMDQYELFEKAETHCVTVVEVVPSMFNSYLQLAGEKGILPLCSMRLLLLTGEKIEPSLVERFFQDYSMRLLNSYGQTEYTDDALYYEILYNLETEMVPIGKPAPNTRVYILNRHYCLQPLGIPGELFVAGDGLASGYLNVPEATHEKFIQNPFNKNEKMYVTGDLARWLFDGNIQFLGRQDQQVKIRGFRIEMGEIETHLLRCPGVKEGAVVTIEKKAGGENLCAFVVSELNKEKEITVAEIRGFLKKNLPEHMVPGYFVLVKQLPKTSSGKIDRRTLVKMEIKSSIAVSTQYVAPFSQYETKIQEIWMELLDRDREQTSINDNFFDLGGHSLLLIQLKSKLEKYFKHEVKITQLLNYPTIAHQARLIEEGLKQDKEEYRDEAATEIKVKSKQRGQQDNRDIAVIGISLRVPGAANIHEFWSNLIDGTEYISFFEENELEGSESYKFIKSRAKLVPAGSVLGDTGLFDADFFGISPAEAEIIDPQHRLFLELAWKVLEDAGYVGETYPGSIGVYAGVGWNIYLLNNVLANPDLINARGELHTYIASDKDFLASRVSYKLNLRGPALVVQTACSTSLVAVHLARQALLCGDCDMALAGGVAVKVPEKTGYIYAEGGHLSPDGHCKPFDAEAKGTVFGNGAGIVILKRLAEARKDNDHIYAVIKGSAINNDGSLKVGYTGPSEAGQSEVILKALQESGVHPHSIGYVETHGTGTVLGDPVEISALTRAFQTGSTGEGIEKDKIQYCAIGAVKANIGHLDTAAGIIGFIKAVLCLKNKQIPASINLEHLNPLIDFANSPFYVNRVLRDWPDNGNDPGAPRRASVSAFGVGGTNAHVVMEEAPQISKSVNQGVSGSVRQESDARKYQLIVLSAKTRSALDRNSFNLAQHLKKNQDMSLADAAYTLQVGRESFKFRRMVVGETTREVSDLLSHPKGNPLVSTQVCEECDKHVIFMFPGQGSQYVDMGRELYKTETVFRQEIDRCFEILKSLMGYDIKEILYPTSKHNRSNRSNRSYKSHMSHINQTEIAQPVIFIFEYALAKLLMTWGIKPHAMIGHSIGEYTAACLAGVFSLEDALLLVAWRGKLMQQMPPGAMLGVSLPEEQLEPLLKPFPQLSLAAVNSSSLCTVSGPHKAVEDFSRELTRTRKAVTATRLHTSHAFHSAMMNAMLAPFEEKVRAITLDPPQLPYISNLTGQWITIENAADPSYWVRHVRNTVRFNQGLCQLLEDTKAVFVEIGPGRALNTFVKKHQSYQSNQPVLNLVRHPRDQVDDAYFLVQRLGHLWLSGVNVDWQGGYRDERRYRLPLPTYSFDHKNYWKYGFMSQGGHPGDRNVEEEEQKKETGKRNPLKNWFYVPTWKPSQKIPPYHPSEIAAGGWLVFMDLPGWGEGLISRIKQDGGHVFLIKQGSQFARLADGLYSLNPHNPGDYEKLLKSLTAEKKVPPRIVHLWNISGDDEGATPARASNLDRLNRFPDMGFYSLIYLAQAVGKLGITDELSIIVVTDRMQTVTPDEISPGIAVPLYSTLLGACRVIPKEYTNLHCRCIDMVLPGPGSQQNSRLYDQLLAEFIKTEGGKGWEPEAAYRSGIRWARDFEPIFPDPPREVARRLKSKGVYLVTGGLGGIGLVLAQYLAARVLARLILTDLSPFPDPAEYNRWLADHGEQDTISQQIGKLKELSALGAEVTVVRADAADYSCMKALIKDTVHRYGGINGIIHAAGVPDGGVIQAKTREAMEAVMAPKIKGTLVLDAILSEMSGDFTPDFFILCSSINSVLGVFGQVAYTAANVFLDYFARYKNSRPDTSGSPGTWVVSINWDTWQEVGMAVKAESRLQCHKVAHPLFHHCTNEKANEIVFNSTFRVKDFWVLDEHRLMGKPVLPGTAYLEMARAAYEQVTGNTTVEFREVYLLAPLVVEENQEREVRTILNNQEDTGKGEFSFSVISRLSNPTLSNSPTCQWQEHARGKMIPLGLLESHEFPGVDPGQLMAGCREDDAAIIDLSYFGPRWSNIKNVKYGKDRRMAVLELASAFAPEVSTYKLHPALLDMALSYLDKRIMRGERYIPFSYKGIKMYQPLPHKLLSEVQIIANPSPTTEILAFAVRIMDEKGSVCVEIENFTIKRLKGEKSAIQPLLSDDTRNLRLEIPAASTGNLEALELKPIPRRKPGPGQVEIEVYAAGLNFKEVLFALGMLSPPGPTISFGLECSGRICALGEGVKEFQVGDAVIAFASPAFSRFLVAPASAVAHKPGHLNFEEAATLPIAFLTAYYSLITLGRLQEGERVLIHSASGGVGLAAVKIARWKRAEIFATAGNPEKRKYLSSLGIKYVMDSRSLDFADEINKVTGGKGVDVLLNSLAGEFISKGLSIMAPYGRFLEIGVRDIFNNSQLGMRAFEKGISFFAVNASSEIPGFTVIFREIAAQIEKGDFGPLPYRVFLMENAGDAFKYMSQAKHIGKIVITHPDRLEQHAHEFHPGEGLLSKGIRPAEGVEVLDRILDQVPMHLEQPFSQVAISTIDLATRIRKSYHGAIPDVTADLPAVRTFGTKELLKPRPPLSTDYVPPTAEMETQVARVWQEFLGLEKVGIHDNFFELGASSLDIIQVNNKLSKLLKKELSVVTFYTYPTVRSLVEYLGEKPSMEVAGSKQWQSDREPRYSKSKKTLKSAIKKIKHFEKI
jgi:amino acid adenylation domain-containing protein